MRGTISVFFAILVGMSAPAYAQSGETLTIHENVITDFRSVVARLEASDSSTARARIAGVITRLNIDEGSVVKQGETLAIIRDETITPQVAALDARLAGIENQLSQYETDYARGEKLHRDGYFTTAKLDELRTSVDITRKNLSAARSERAALITRRTKGIVTAPSEARVTEVLVTQGSVVSPGEILAKLATLDGVVRLSLPERHAGQISEGETIQLQLPARSGEIYNATITKIYPELRNGAVIADAVVDGGLSALVGERVDVLAPVGERRAFLVPVAFITTRYGIDFVKIHVGEHIIDAPVTLSNPRPDADGMVEVLSGLHEGDVIEKP